MTTKPRRPSSTRIGSEIADHTPTPARIPELMETTTTPTPIPAPIGLAPVVDRLAILNDYADQDGLLPVVVVVAHDAVFVGQHIRVPVTDRVAGLVERGFLEVEPPEPGTRR